jgi:hypothetical protein
LRPDLAVLSATRAAARVVFGPRNSPSYIRKRRDSITGQVRKSTRLIPQLRRCLEYNYFLLLPAQSFIHIKQSILFLFVINNDLGSTFEARRWGDCFYDSLEFVTPAHGKKASKTLKSTGALYRDRGARKISQYVVEKDR